MELTLIDANVGIELMESMSKGDLTLEAVNMIIEALNNKSIEATYKSEITKDVLKGNGAIYTVGTGVYEDKSNIQSIIDNFKCIKLKFGIDEAIKNLKMVLAPKKTYKRKYKRY